MALVYDPESGKMVETPLGGRRAAVRNNAPVAPTPQPTGAARVRGQRNFDVTNTPDTVLGGRGQPPAQPVPVAAATTPAAPAATIPTAVPTTPEPVPFQPMDIAGENARLAQRVAASRPEAGVMQPAERGNYNQYNTDQVALAARAAPTEGVNLGFGEGVSASQYLAQMAAQDRQDAAQMAQQRSEVSANQQRRALAYAASKGDLLAIRQMQMLDNRQAQSVTEAGLNTRQTKQLAAQSEQAQIQGAASLQAALAKAESTLGAAEIDAGATTEAARLRGIAQLGAAEVGANSGGSMLAQQRAQTEALRIQAIQDAAAAGDVETLVALLGGGRAREDGSVDPLSGVQYLPEAEALIQQQQLQRLLNQQ